MATVGSQVGGASPFKGATAGTNGSSGLVPAPLAGEQNEFLRGDGTWQPVGAPTGYQTVDNNGVALPAQTVINFDGTALVASDNVGANRTDITPAATLVDIAGLTPSANSVIVGNGTHFVTSTSYQTIQNATVGVTKRNILNLTGAGITATDNGGTSSTDVALSTNLQDISALTPANHSIIAGNGTHFVDTVPSLTNVYYVAKNGDDTSGNGSQLFPYLTVGAACTAIGNAANSAAFNDVTKRYYTINIAPGIYVENVTVPSRPDVIFDMHGSVIQGTFVQDLDRTLLTGGLNTAKVSVIGYDLRGAHAGLSLPKIGIDGSITMGSSVGANNFTSLYLINTGVTGGVAFTGVNPGYQGFLFTQNTNILGSITTSGTGVNINLYLSGADSSGSAAIGAINGYVNFTSIKNIFFNGAVVTTSNLPGRLIDTVFKAAQAHNFSGCSSALQMDANSYDSYFNNVPTKGSETITLIDTARGVLAGYTPVNYTAADTSVRGNLSGIDTALGTLSPFTWVGVAGTSQTMVKNTGYFSDNVALTTFTLPAVAARGDTFKIQGVGAGGWTVAQNAGQSIEWNGVATTAGVTGHLDSTAATNSVELVCTTVNTGFKVFTTNAQLNLA